MPLNVNFTGRPPTIDDVLRHEVGHAVMAARLGYRLEFLVFGMLSIGFPYGWAKYEPGQHDDHDIAILSAGTLALYFHDVPGEPSLRTFLNWLGQNEYRAAGGIADWKKILKLAGMPIESNLPYYVQNAIVPYFEDTARALYSVLNDIDELTDFARINSPGLGPRALQRHFSGAKVSVLDRWLDRNVVSWANRQAKARAEPQ